MKISKENPKKPYVMNDTDRSYYCGCEKYNRHSPVLRPLSHCGKGGILKDRSQTQDTYCPYLKRKTKSEKKEKHRLKISSIPTSANPIVKLEEVKESSKPTQYCGCFKCDLYNGVEPKNEMIMPNEYCPHSRRKSIGRDEKKYYCKHSLRDQDFTCCEDCIETKKLDGQMKLVLFLKRNIVKI